MLRSAWIDALFAKLTVRYGVAFLRQWPDAEPALIKADWAEVLDGFSGSDIKYALEHLDPDKPPTAMQFRRLCNSAPRDELLSITRDVKPEPERVQQIADRVLAAKPAGKTPAEQCAENILRIVQDRGGKISIPQRQQLAAMQSQWLIDLPAEVIDRLKIARHLGEWIGGKP